jgi:hypothetical protein
MNPARFFCRNMFALSCLAVMFIIDPTLTAFADDYSRIRAIHSGVNGLISDKGGNPTASLDDCKIDPIHRYPVCSLYYKASRIEIMDRTRERDLQIALVGDLTRSDAFNDLFSLWLQAYDSASGLSDDRKLELLNNMKENFTSLPSEGGTLSFRSGEDRIELGRIMGVIIMTVYAGYR